MGETYQAIADGLANGYTGIELAKIGLGNSAWALA